MMPRRPFCINHHLNQEFESPTSTISTLGNSPISDFEQLSSFSPERRIYIEAHRGGMGLEPENTIRAFRNAIDLGVDSVEFDVWLCKEGVPVVIHGENDGNIKKNTNIDRYVGDCELEFLKTLDVGQGEKIPTLEELFQFFKFHTTILNIEIKGDQAELPSKVYELIEKHNFYGKCAVSSFNHNFLDELKKLTQGKLELGYLWNFHDDDLLPESEILFSKGNTINIRVTRITKAVVVEAHKRKFGVQVWIPFKIPETTELHDSLIDMGVDIICTNYPDKLQSRILERTKLGPKGLLSPTFA